MNRFFFQSFTLNFWASPASSFVSEILGSPAWALDREMKSLDPGFPGDVPSEQPARRVVPPMPTDVPMPEPHDVPVPEPIDVPPPDPGKKPLPATKPLPDETKPRPIP